MVPSVKNHEKKQIQEECGKSGWGPNTHNNRPKLQNKAYCQSLKFPNFARRNLHICLFVSENQPSTTKLAAPKKLRYADRNLGVPSRSQLQKLGPTKFIANQPTPP